MSDLRQKRETLKKLKALAEDQKGRPEGDAAQAKIDFLVAKYPQLSIAFKPTGEFTTRDYVRLKRAGVDMSGSWTGRNYGEAIMKMQLDFMERMERYLSENDGEFRDDLQMAVLPLPEAV